MNLFLASKTFFFKETYRNKIYVYVNKISNRFFKFSALKSLFWYVHGWEWQKSLFSGTGNEDTYSDIEIARSNLPINNAVV